MEGDPACAREVHVPLLREVQLGARAVSCDCARLGCSQSSRHDPVREVRQHQPLNRQAERYAREGVPLSLSTLADQSGPVALCLSLFSSASKRTCSPPSACTSTTRPFRPCQGKTDTGRCSVYVRDDRPFGGCAPPAAMFYYSRYRAGEHPETHLATYAGSSRLTPIAATTSYTRPIANRGRSSRPPAVRTPAARFSPC